MNPSRPTAVYLGTDDLMRMGDPGALATTPDQVATSLAAFIARLQEAKPDLTILVAQVAPCGSIGKAYCRKELRAFNEVAGGFDALSTQTSRVIVVHMYTGFSLEWIYRAGFELSPTDTGDQVIAQRWMDALREAGLI